MAKEICKECQCRTCWLIIPDGGPNDCHHCDGCLEDKPMINCNNYDSTNKFGGNQHE